MTIPKITPYSGGVANPDGSQTQTEFTQNMFDQLSYEAELSTELNNTVDGINDTANQVDADATSAAKSANDAEAAASGLNYQGLWPDTGGSANKGDTYQTQVSGTGTGQYFTALQDTTVDPVGDDVNWRAVGNVNGIANAGDSQISGGTIWPTAINEYADSGKTIPSKTGVIRCINDRLYSILPPVNADLVIDSVNLDLNRIQIQGESTYRLLVRFNPDLPVRTFHASQIGLTPLRVDNSDVLNAFLDKQFSNVRIIFDYSQLLFENSIVFNPNSKNVIFESNGCELKFTNDVIGLTCHLTNENYGPIKLYNMSITGINGNYFDPDPFQSTQPCVSLDRAYYFYFENCDLQKFYIGARLNFAIKNTFVNCRTNENSYGLALTGNAVNANNFIGGATRRNQFAGVLIDGTAPFPSNNFFRDYLYESNGLYNVTPNQGSAIIVKQGYLNLFQGGYIENSQYSLDLRESGDGNRFENINVYYNVGGEGTVKISGNATNAELNRMQAPGGLLTFEVDPSTTNSRILVKDCEGVDVLKNDNIEYINCNVTYTGAGDIVTNMKLFKSMDLNNPGTEFIPGIGSTNAVLDTKGYPSFTLGTLITSDTTIVDITNVEPNSIFILNNHQSSSSVTIKASSNPTSALQMVGGEDCILDNFGQHIAFWCNRFGRLIELRRVTSERAVIPRDTRPSWAKEGKIYPEEGKNRNIVRYGANWYEIDKTAI